VNRPSSEDLTPLDVVLGVVVAYFTLIVMAMEAK